MATWAVTRCSTPKQIESPEVQRHAINAYCERMGLTDITILDEPIGTNSCIPFRHRPQGRKILVEARRGDSLVCTDLDRLGRNVADILNTVDRLKAKGVKLVVLQFYGMDLDLNSDMGYLVLMIFAWGSAYEHRRIFERTQRAIQRKKELGLLIYQPGLGRKKIVDEHGSHGEWDYEQLAIIAEISERIGKGQDPAKVAADLWRRGIKDHRGKPWGKVYHTGKGKGQGSEVENFQRAVRWFHRQKHAGKLPPPYCDMAKLIPEGSRFTVGIRPKRMAPKIAVNPKAAWTAEQWAEWAAIECMEPPSGIS